jgi:hypothetical protein
MVPDGFYKVSAFADFEGSIQPTASVRKIVLRLDSPVVVPPMPRPVG